MMAHRSYKRPMASRTDTSYTILRRLGQGGMAEVFLVRDEVDGQRLAVMKRILPSRAESPEFVRMFLEEVRLASMLFHPNICQVYSAGQTEGAHHYLMEYVHGDDLRHLLRCENERAQRMPLACALLIARRIAEGLHYAHERHDSDGHPLEIVHRDVNPSNIMLGYEGSVKLLDFGIAKATRRTVDTTTGLIKGKVSYMAPEQCRGRSVDRRTDIFALGIVLWEMTTGMRLFEADDDVAKLNMIVNQDAPAPSSLCAGYPQELDDIVLRALRRRPDDRFQTARELAETLEAFTASSGLAATEQQLSAYLRELLPERSRRAAVTISDLETQPRDGSYHSPTAPALLAVDVEQPVARRPSRWLWVGAGIVGGAAVASVASLGLMRWSAANTANVGAAPAIVVQRPTPAPPDTLQRSEGVGSSGEGLLGIDKIDKDASADAVGQPAITATTASSADAGPADATKKPETTTGRRRRAAKKKRRPAHAAPTNNKQSPPEPPPQEAPAPAAEPPPLSDRIDRDW